VRGKRSRPRAISGARGREREREIERGGAAVSLYLFFPPAARPPVFNLANSIRFLMAFHGANRRVSALRLETLISFSRAGHIRFVSPRRAAAPRQTIWPSHERFVKEFGRAVNIQWYFLSEETCISIGLLKKNPI
jgi:hypothetical protein